MFSNRFKPGEAGTMTLVGGELVNYGAIEESDGWLMYYTGKGLHEIFKPQTDAEKAAAPALLAKVAAEAWDDLKRSGHVAVIEVAQVMSTN